MDSKLILVLAVVGVFVWFAVKNQGKQNGPEQLCASDVLALIKRNHDASAAEIVEVFKAHHRTRADIGEVTKLVVAQLRKIGIRKEDHQDIISNVRKAKLMLPD